MRGQSKSALRWLLVLQAAEAWGVPPWVIMEGPDSERWLRRYVVYKQELAQVEEEEHRRQMAKMKKR